MRNYFNIKKHVLMQCIIFFGGSIVLQVFKSVGIDLIIFEIRLVQPFYFVCFYNIVLCYYYTYMLKYYKRIQFIPIVILSFIFVNIFFNLVTLPLFIYELICLLNHRTNFDLNTIIH